MVETHFSSQCNRLLVFTLFLPSNVSSIHSSFLPYHSVVILPFSRSRYSFFYSVVNWFYRDVALMFYRRSFWSFLLVPNL